MPPTTTKKLRFMYLHENVEQRFGVQIIMQNTVYLWLKNSVAVEKSRFSSLSGSTP